MPSRDLQRTLSKIRSKLGFRSLSHSSTKKPPHSNMPTLTKEEAAGEEKVARSDDTKLKEKGDLTEEKNLIGGSNVKGQEITRARESQEQLKNGESKRLEEDLLDSLSDEIGKGKSKRTRDKKVHDANMRNREKEDSTSSPFPIERGEEIKMAMEGEDIEKEKPTSAPLPKERGEKEIKRVIAVVEEEEQGHGYIVKGKEDTKPSSFPLESGRGGIKMMPGEGEKQAGDRRDGGKEQTMSSAFPEDIGRVGEEKEQVRDTKIKEKEDSTSSPFTIKSGGEGIKMTEEGEDQGGDRRDREKEEPTPAPLANGTGGEKITRARGREEEAHDSIFGQKEDSTSSRFPYENGKEENKVTEKGEEQDGDKRDRGKEESISATLPNESGGEEIKRMKGGEPTSLLPSESGTEKMKKMDEGLEQGVDMRKMEKEDLTSSPLPDKSGWTAMKRMTKREEHCIDRRDKEKEDSASSPFSSESGREETKWVSEGEEQAGGGRNQDKEDSTSFPPSLMPMPKSEKVPLGEQLSPSLPSEATTDQERKFSETREGQTSDRSHQIKEDSVPFPLIQVLESKAIDVGEKMPQNTVSSSSKQIIEEGWRLERGDKAPETKEGGGKAEHIAFSSAVITTTSGEDLDAAGSSIVKHKSIVTRKEEEEILKDHKELEMKPFLLLSESEEEIKRMNEGQLVPKGGRSSWKKEDSMPMLATNMREADTSLYSSPVSITEEEEERSRSTSTVAFERIMPSSAPVSAPTSGEDLIGESNRMEHKGIRSKEGQEEDENRKISKITKEEITRAGEKQAQGLLEHDMLIKLGNGSMTTTLLAAIQETIHKEIEVLMSTLFSAKEELKGQVEGAGVICRKTPLKIKESDEEGREREELSSREKSRLMSCPSSTPTTKEEEIKKSDVEGKSGEKTQAPRRDGKAPKEIEGREVVEQMRDGDDERNIASSSHMPKLTDEEKTSLGKEQEKKGGTSFGSSSGKALGVLGVMAAITSIGAVVLMKRLENVRSRKPN